MVYVVLYTNHYMIQSAKSTHGLCKDCLTKGGLNLLSFNKPNHCISCQKQPQLLYNQDPYCSSCYILSISSPSKSDLSSQRGGHQRNKSFYRPIDKQQVRSMKKSFISLSGKLIKKISKVFQQNETQLQLVSFLNKKATGITSCDWDKFTSKVSKNSNIIYIFIGKNKIIGGFHSQSVSIDGETSVFDQEAGIFFTQKSKIQLQFARVKSDLVTYSSKSKTVRFGSPSSLQISFEKQIKLTSEVAEDFQWVYFYIYRP